MTGFGRCTFGDIGAPVTNRKLSSDVLDCKVQSLGRMSVEYREGRLINDQKQLNCASSIYVVADLVRMS